MAREVPATAGRAASGCSWGWAGRAAGRCRSWHNAGRRPGATTRPRTDRASFFQNRDFLHLWERIPRTGQGHGAEPPERRPGVLEQRRGTGEGEEERPSREGCALNWLLPPKDCHSHHRTGCALRESSEAERVSVPAVEPDQRRARSAARARSGGELYFSEPLTAPHDVPPYPGCFLSFVPPIESPPPAPCTGSTPVP